MKKVLPIILVIAILMGVFAGCSSQAPETSAAPVEISSATETPEATPTPEQPEVTDPDGIPDDISPTTGLQGTTTVYRPVIVQIDNEPPGRPQTGLQWADIVYETMIEGIDTRLTCVFNDIINSADAPEKVDVGPVRSSRYYHQWIQGEWDALYVHMGGPDKTNNSESDIWGASNDHIKQRINGAGKYPSNSDLFHRGPAGKPIEVTAYTDVKADLEVYSYEPKQREPFKYYPLESYDGEKSIDSVELSFWSKPGWVEYKYDAGEDKLVRYMNGKEFITQETGTAVRVQNLIIQYVSVSDMPNDGGRKKVTVFGSGPAEFIVHGKHLTGTWEREDNSDATKYYLESGEEVTLTPGNTWIEMHPNDRAVVYNYTDGSDSTTND